MDQKILSVAPKTSKIPLESAGKVLFDRMNTFKKDSIALIEMKSGTFCTYGDLITYSVNLASNLRSLLKITKNDNLGIVSENSYKFWVAMLAGLYVAAPCHLLNPGFTIHELKKYLMMSEPKLVFCTKQSLSKLKKLRNECPFLKWIVLFDEESDDVVLFDELIKDKPTGDFFFEEITGFGAQVAYIANSSGTTGLPKGAMITHENLRLNFSHCEDDDLYPFNSDSVVIHVVPFYHVYGSGVGYCGLYLGVKFLTMDQFHPQIYLENVQKHRVNKVFIVPTLGDFLAHSSSVDAYDLSSVQEVYLAAGVLRKTTEEKLLRRFNIKSIRRVYGLTELAATVFITPLGETKPDTCGKLTPGHQVKIVDLKTGEVLGCNQTGEICIKGASMKGYVNDVERTRATFDSDGFIRTGDVGYYDEEHYFYIIDRLKDLIKYKSFQVPPLEIEEILLQHPKIEDVAVVGKPDDRYGELPVAFVVKKDGADVGEKEVVDYVAQFVCLEKRLHGGVRFVGEIPRNTIGKILRKDLRNMLQ